MIKKLFLIIVLAILVFNVSCKKNPTSSNNPTTLMDIDGIVYETVFIGDQIWMAENLKVTHYRNGEEIPIVTSDTEWSNLTTGAYSSYDNDNNNVDTYGLLYNWYAVNDNRNLAPTGWHVPTDEEWKQLEMYLGMGLSEADDTGCRDTDEGNKLKETGIAHWNIPNEGATNESGFSALPGGLRSSAGTCDNIGYYTYFWSATEGDSGNAWYRFLHYNRSCVSRYNSNKQNGFSVRCVKD